MGTKQPYLYLIFAIGLGLASFLLVFWQWAETSIVQNDNTIASFVNFSIKNDPAVILQAKQHKPKQREVKGLYLTAYSAGNRAMVDYIIGLLDITELNAVVIDIKDYSGKVLYDSQLPLVEALWLKQNRIGDMKALVDKLHEHDIYVIARQTVFQDPILAEQKPEWAIKSKSGGIWRDNKGLSWVDPTNREVWQYNVAVAKEAIDFGFDEINFDYVRFPSDGKLSQVVYTNGEEPKYEVMRQFYAYLREQLDKEPAWISLDMFGYVMEREDDLSIGQRLVDAVAYADYICPMMYPSHYSQGHLGVENPAEIPGAVIDNGMQRGMIKFTGAYAQVRPWLQAFSLGAVYDAGKIRAQIDAVEKYSNAGWLLWNASNRYTTAGLKME